MKLNRMHKLALGGLLVTIACAAAWAEFFEPAHGGAMFIEDDVMMAAPGPGMFEMPLMAPAPAPFASPFHLMALIDVLELDKAQRDQVGKVMDEAMPRMRELMFRMSDSRKALEKAHENGITDDKEMRRLADEQGRITADMMYLHMKMRADVRSILTEEQVQKLEEFHGAHGPKMFHRRLGKTHHD